MSIQTTLTAYHTGQLRVGAGPVARGAGGAHGDDLRRIRPIHVPDEHEEVIIIIEFLRNV